MMYLWKVQLKGGKKMNVISKSDNRSTVWNKLTHEYEVKEVTFVGYAHLIDR